MTHDHEARPRWCGPGGAHGVAGIYGDCGTSAEGGAPHSRGRKAANGFVTTREREANRYSAAGRPPADVGRDSPDVGSITSRRVKMRCRFVAETSCPSAAAYRSRSCAMVNVSGASANPMFV